MTTEQNHIHLGDHCATCLRKRFDELKPAFELRLLHARALLEVLARTTNEPASKEKLKELDERFAEFKDFCEATEKALTLVMSKETAGIIKNLEPVCFALTNIEMIVRNDFMHGIMERCGASH